MKFPFVLPLLLVSTIAFGAEDKRCGMPKTEPCRQNYSRVDAFDALLDAEGGNVAEAQANLTLLLEVYDRYKLSLQYWVDNFLYIQAAVGGYHYTTETQRAFNSIIKQIDSVAVPMHDLTTQMVNHLKFEANIDDGILHIVHVKISGSDGKMEFESLVKNLIAIISKRVT